MAGSGPAPVELDEGTADHDLRLGSGDEDPAIHHQLEGAEAPDTEHVLERFAGRSAFEHLVEEGDFAAGDRPVEGQDQIGARLPRSPLHETTGVGGGVVIIPEIERGEAALRLLAKHPPRHHATVTRSCTTGR